MKKCDESGEGVGDWKNLSVVADSKIEKLVNYKIEGWLIVYMLI